MKKAYLVGAGPGDPELITIKGLRAIETADVILYDALSSEKLLEYAPDNAELIYVGKRCGKHSLKQQDINALLAQMAKKHNQIVRLKGGDPFIFGRGYEEMDFLRELNIDVEVIPGISSVTGVPARQGVPLTSRNVSESFWVLTGTTKDHKLSKDIDLAVQSSATLVILMGMRSLDKICDKLMRAGKRDTPMMIVQNGTCKNEKLILGSAETLMNKLEAGYESSPGIIIVGEVVALHPQFIHEYALETWEI